MASLGVSTGLVYSVTSLTEKPTFIVEKWGRRVRKMSHSVITRCRIQAEELHRGGRRFRAALLTLTYRPGTPWAAGHISKLLEAACQYLSRHGVTPRYQWVMELMRSGVPHYHILFFLPRGHTLPKPDKRGWWVHGLTRIEWARNPVGYLAKYASKGNGSTHFPKGARIHGGRGLEVGGRLEARWWACPRWVRAIWTVEDAPQRSRGGYMSAATGEWRRCPYEIVSHSPDWSIIVMRERVSDGATGTNGVLHEGDSTDAHIPCKTPLVQDATPVEPLRWPRIAPWQVVDTEGSAFPARRHDSGIQRTEG